MHIYFEIVNLLIYFLLVIIKTIDQNAIKFVLNLTQFHLFVTMAGLNKEFRKMLSENASFKSLMIKDIHEASDGTRKVVS